MSTQNDVDFTIHRYSVPIRVGASGKHDTVTVADPLTKAPSYSMPLVFEDVIDMMRVSPNQHISQLSHKKIAICSSLYYSNTARLQIARSATRCRVLLTACRVEQVFGRYIKIKVHGILAASSVHVAIDAHRLPIYVRGYGTLTGLANLQPRELCRLGCADPKCRRHFPTPIARLT